MKWKLLFGSVLSCALVDSSALAQDVAGGLPSPIILADSASPFTVDPIKAQEEAAITMPFLEGPVTPEDEASFAKYFYFRRADTDLQTAFADISECDGYARGLKSGLSDQPAPYPYTYTMAGAVGGAIGNALAAAIVGSAQKRQLRRDVMRTCMGFKGYDRHGLPKKVWQYFNFEEGLTSVDEAVRRERLMQQALVAAKGPAVGKVLER